MTYASAPVVLSPAIRAAIDEAVARLRDDQRGRLQVAASLTGVDVSVAQRGPGGSLIGGYARRLWGGGWEAGARFQVGW